MWVSLAIRHGPIPAEIIAAMGRQVVSGIEGASVYLVGSYAYGKPHRHSDVDLAVIYPDELASTQSHVDSLARYLCGHPEIPKDVIAIRRSRFDRLGSMRGTFSYLIRHQGVRLG